MVFRDSCILSHLTSNLISPPRGRFSHLAMFRIGSALFVPAYLVVTLLRPFASASADGNLALMSGMSLSLVHAASVLTSSVP